MSGIFEIILIFAFLASRSVFIFDTIENLRFWVFCASFLNIQIKTIFAFLTSFCRGRDSAICNFQRLTSFLDIIETSIEIAMNETWCLFNRRGWLKSVSFLEIQIVVNNKSGLTSFAFYCWKKLATVIFSWMAFFSVCS